MTGAGEAPLLEVALDHAFAAGFRLELTFATRARSLAVFGGSGSGKSTLLGLIAGTLAPRRGHVRLRGRTLVDTARGVRLPPRARGVGLVLQEGLLFPLLTVRENLAFGAPPPARRRLALERVAALLEVEHLLERRPRNLSGGERQRVALGRAVLHEPDVLLCDEPFAALDVARRDRLLPVLARVRDELDLPLVLVTHSPAEVLALADDVLVLDDGRVRAQGPPHDVLGELGDDGAATNFWEGVVEAAGEAPLADVRVGGAEGALLHVALEHARPGQRVRLSVAAEHVALGPASAGEGGSPRNRLAGHVVASAEAGGLVSVTVAAGALRVRALVTASAARELALAVGAEVTASIKATAIRVLSASG